MSSVRLAQVTFADCPLPVQAVQMPDGLAGATLRSLCAALSLDYASQYQRIRRAPALREALQLVTLVTPGGPQAVDVIPAWVIPVWLAGLQINRLPEEKRTLIAAFQREAVATIERAFTQPEYNASSVPEAPVSQIPVPEATSQPSLRQVRQGLLLAAEGIANFEVEHQALVERVTILESGPARLTVVGVSPQRLAQLYSLAYQVRQRYSHSIAETLAGLADRFRVEDVYFLSEKDWPAILEWFSTMLEDEAP